MGIRRRGVLSEEAAFQQRNEIGKEPCGCLREEDFKPGGMACAKALGQYCTWHVGGAVRKSTWLEQSEQGGEKEEVRAGRGQGRFYRAM